MSRRPAGVVKNELATLPPWHRQRQVVNKLIFSSVPIEQSRCLLPPFHQHRSQCPTLSREIPVDPSRRARARAGAAPFSAISADPVWTDACWTKEQARPVTPLQVSSLLWAATSPPGDRLAPNRCPCSSSSRPTALEVSTTSLLTTNSLCTVGDVDLQK
jgi:hypothetical protein